MVPNAMRRRDSWRIAGDLPASFRYAAQGLGYAFLTQRNFRIHVVTGLVVFGLANWLQLDLIHLAVLVLTVAAVLVLELLNTAMEAVVDLAIGRRYHPLARIAKDCAAAAVHLGDGLMAQAHPQGGHRCGKLFEDVEADARLIWVAWAWGEQDRVGLQGTDLLDADGVVAMHLQLSLIHISEPTRPY